jgi:hypothetical protein
MATPLTEEEKKLANAGIVNSGPSPLTPEELALFNESVTQEENNVAPENEVNLINSARHSAGGTLSGAGDTFNLLSAIPNAMRYVQSGGMLPSIPDATNLLKKIPVVGPAFDEFSQPLYSPEQIEQNPQAKAANAIRSTLEWFQPGGFGRKALANTAGIAVAAGSGQYAFGDTGEITTGLVASLLALKKGKATDKDVEAINLFAEQAGITVDQLIIDIDRAVRDGAIGTLGEVAENTGIMRVEKLLKNQSGGGAETQKYIDDIEGLDAQRNKAIVDDVTFPLRVDDSGVGIPMRETADSLGNPILDPSVTAAAKIIEDRTNDVAKAMDAELDKIDVQETEIRDAPITTPTQQFDELEANRLLQQDRANEIQQRTINEQQSLTDFREAGKERTLNAIPEAKRAEVTSGVNMDDPLERFAAVQNYWKTDAFKEVKNKEGGFTLPDELAAQIKATLNTDEGRLELGEFFDTVTDEFRRVRGIDRPDKTAEDFSRNEYINEVFSGQMSGNAIMTLRNFFANRAAKSFDNNATSAPVQSALRSRVQEVIRDGLNPEELSLFDSEMIAYPSYKAEQKLMNTDAVVGNYGVATPTQQIAAGSNFGRPGLESSRKFLNQQEALEELTKTAVEAEKQAVGAVASSETALTRAINSEQRQIGNQQKSLEGLERTRETLERTSNAEKKAITQTPLGRYENDPSSFIKNAFKTEKKAIELGQVFNEISDAGQKDAFRMTVAKELTDVLTDGNSKMNAASRKKFDDLRNRLNQAGLLKGEELNRMQEVLLRTVVNDLRKQVDGSFRIVTESEADKIASSVVAAFALQLTGSSSLILAGTTKRVVANALKDDKAYDVLIRKLREMSLDPQKFIDEAQLVNAKNAKSMARQIMIALVGAGKATEYFTED